MNYSSCFIWSWHEIRQLDICMVFYFEISCLTVHADPEKNATVPEKQSDTTETEDQPTETQSAQCTITAGDVQASAQATISKKLEGVCGSSKTE